MNVFFDGDFDELDAINLIVNGLPRQIYQRTEYFHSFDENNFLLRFRLSKRTAINLLEQIEPQLEYPYNLYVFHITLY